MSETKKRLTAPIAVGIDYKKFYDVKFDNGESMLVQDTFSFDLQHISPSRIQQMAEAGDINISEEHAAIILRALISAENRENFNDMTELITTLTFQCVYAVIFWQVFTQDTTLLTKVIVALSLVIYLIGLALMQAYEMYIVRKFK